MWTRMGRQINKGCSVLLEKLPEVERGRAAKGGSGHSPDAKQNPTGREGRHFG